MSKAKYQTNDNKNNPVLSGLILYLEALLLTLGLDWRLSTRPILPTIPQGAMSEAGILIQATVACSAPNLTTTKVKGGAVESSAHSTTTR